MPNLSNPPQNLPKKIKSPIKSLSTLNHHFKSQMETRPLDLPQAKQALHDLLEGYQREGHHIDSMTFLRNDTETRDPLLIYLITATDYLIFQQEEVLLPLMFEVLNQGGSAHHVNNKGHSVLQYAINRPIPSIVTLLMDRGADLNHVDPDGETALFDAAQQINPFSIKAILSHSSFSKINQCDRMGENALYHALHMSDFSASALALIEGGIRLKQSNESSLLYRVAGWQDTTVAKALIQAGSGFEFLKGSHRNLLSEAARYANKPLLTLLLEQAYPSAFSWEHVQEAHQLLLSHPLSSAHQSCEKHLKQLMTVLEEKRELDQMLLISNNDVHSPASPELQSAEPPIKTTLKRSL